MNAAIVRIEANPAQAKAAVHSPIWAKGALKGAGARWDPDERVWTVEDVDLAEVVEALKREGFVVHLDHVTDTPAERRAKRRRAIEQMRELKRALLGALPLPLILMGGLLIDAGAGVTP